VYTSVAADNHLSKGGNPLGIVDRLVRTLKSYITKYMLAHDSVKWTLWLKDIIKLYNDVPNAGIKDMTPNEVFDDEDYSEKLFEAQSKQNEKIKETIPLKVGDSVRAALGKRIFEKEREKFSKEIYTIASTRGYRYTLRDENGKIGRRRYRAQDLLPVTSKAVVDRIKSDATSDKKVTVDARPVRTKKKPVRILT
jgi:hypothetical protein